MVRLVNEFGEQIFVEQWVFHFYQRLDYLGFRVTDVVAHA